MVTVTKESYKSELNNKKRSLDPILMFLGSNIYAFKPHYL